jgi:hypothetical protein
MHFAQVMPPDACLMQLFSVGKFRVAAAGAVAVCLSADAACAMHSGAGSA